MSQVVTKNVFKIKNKFYPDNVSLNQGRHQSLFISRFSHSSTEAFPPHRHATINSQHRQRGPDEEWEILDSMKLLLLDLMELIYFEL